MNRVVIITDRQKLLSTGWRWVKLKDMGTIDAGGTPAKERDDYWNGDIPFVTGADIINFKIGKSNARAYLTKKGLYSGKTAICNTGTVLIVTRTRVGRAGISSETMGASQDITAFNCGPEIDPEFLCRFLHNISQYLIENCRGATIQGLTRDFIENIEIPLPPLYEQQRIAALLKEQLAAVDKARLAAQARLEAIKALPTAYLHVVFGDLPAFSAAPVTFKKPIQPGWTWHRLTDIARLATGHTPSRYNPEYWGGEIPWLQLADIRALDGRVAFTTSEYTNDLGIENSSSVLLPKDTVCMSRTASVGFFTIMGRPMATSQDFVNWVCSDMLDPWFLMYLLVTWRENIRDLGSGAVHKTIYLPTVQAFNICIPPITEQRRFSSTLREQLAMIEKTRLAAEAELKTINALPATLLRRAFNGEL